ncbi:hypothetical protein PR003_g21971 [Phytophthora rubi]|uniref:Uncharacterized protein n=1 Tax=Phytophthora rubi TaxID=129364 RepID=A0A6A3JNP6_9STRA|nr:hypothetical protein PR001_g20737 [Phytophthora rubi]KAE9303587.1 hypothetical protein PR003_g21971 [Phytophthora rubi]
MARSLWQLPQLHGEEAVVARRARQGASGVAQVRAGITSVVEGVVERLKYGEKMQAGVSTVQGATAVH